MEEAKNVASNSIIWLQAQSTFAIKASSSASATLSTSSFWLDSRQVHFCHQGQQVDRGGTLGLDSSFGIRFIRRGSPEEEGGDGLVRCIRGVVSSFHNQKATQIQSRLDIDLLKDDLMLKFCQKQNIRTKHYLASNSQKQI